tara:strand:- start:607 stop:840 length:234 start_codon:yes stop_codon:yes gene_type:complete
MTQVYVLRYSLPYESTEMVSVYENLRGAMNRLAMMDANNSFDMDETVTIECQEVITEQTSLDRLESMRNYHKNKENN